MTRVATLSAKKINGEALMTAASATREFAIQIVEIHAERVLAQVHECQQEIGVIETGDPGPPLLGDMPLAIAVHGGGEAHIVVQAMIEQISKIAKYVLKARQALVGRWLSGMQDGSGQPRSLEQWVVVEIVDALRVRQEKLGIKDIAVNTLTHHHKSLNDKLQGPFRKDQREGKGFQGPKRNRNSWSPDIHVCLGDGACWNVEVKFRSWWDKDLSDDLALVCMCNEAQWSLWQDCPTQKAALLWLMPDAKCISVKVEDERNAADYVDGN